jgi:hypothetical protein
VHSRCCAVESGALAGGKDRTALLTETSLILAAVFWGTNYAATKFAALSIPPISVVAVRFLVGGLLMYAALRLLEPESKLARKDLLPMAGLGCLGVAIGQTTFTFGVSLTTAANTGFIFATAAVWGLLFGFVLGLERPTWRRRSRRPRRGISCVRRQGPPLRPGRRSGIREVWTSAHVNP